MSLYTVSSESSACCSPSNDTLMLGVSVGGVKGGANPRSLVRPHTNDSQKTESASAVVRAVAADYSKQMEALRDRTSALERCKMLVNKARLTPVKTRNKDTLQPTQIHTELLAAQEKAADGSKVNGFATGEAMKHQTAAGPMTDASSASRNDRQSLKERLTISTKSLEGMQGGGTRKAADSDSSAASLRSPLLQAKDDSSNHLDNTTQHLGAPDTKLLAAVDSEQIQTEPNTQPPALLEPVELPSNPNRDCMRPDYDPITSRSSFHDRTHSLDSNNLNVKSDTNSVVRLSAPAGDPLSDPNSCLPHIDEKEFQGPSKALKSTKTNSVKQLMAKKNAKDEKMNVLHEVGPNEECIAANGSQTAFWIRPSSALYEMTASIAAKRKDTSRIKIGSEGESVENTRGRASCGSKHLSEVSLDDSRPQFTTYFSSHRAPTKGSDSRASKMSARSSNPTVRNSCLVSPRAPSLSYDLLAQSKPSHCSSARPAGSRSPTISVPLSRKNSQSACSNLPASSQRRHLTVSDSNRSSMTLPPTTEHHKASAAKAKAAPPSRPSSRKSDPHISEVLAVLNVSSKQATSALKATNTSPRTTQRRHSVSFDTPQSETSVAGMDPVPDGLPPKATPRNLASSVLVSARSSLSATSMKGRENLPSTIHTSVLESPAEEKRNSTAPFGHSPLNDGKQNLMSTPGKQDGVELSKSKLRSRGNTNALYVSSADHSLIEMDKENILDDNRFKSNRNSHPEGRLSALGTRLRFSANEMVGSMLQGIIQQTRRVLPCYLCAEMINATTYHVHMEICRRTTEELMEEHAIPQRVWEKIKKISRTPVPISSSSQEERDAFVVSCYNCALELVIPCRTCGTRIRIHDAKEHEMLCGKAYYANSKAAQRVQNAADHILSHAVDTE